MKIEQIITDISTKIGKNETYIKGQLTQEKNKLKDKFGDALSDERVEEIALNTLLNRFGINKDDIIVKPTDNITEPLSEDDISDDQYINMIEKEDEDIEKEITSSVKTFDNTDSYNPNRSSNTWKDFMESIPEPTYDKSTSKFERTPSLLLEIGPTYRLKMSDLTTIPNPQTFEGKYGPYAKTPFKVILIGVSDSMLYDQVYSAGEYKGKKAFVNGQKYTLWMDDKCKRAWKHFFLKCNSDGIPDEREFTFRWTKKGNNNIWHFGLPK